MDREHCDYLDVVSAISTIGRGTSRYERVWLSCWALASTMPSRTEMEGSDGSWPSSIGGEIGRLGGEGWVGEGE